MPSIIKASSAARFLSTLLAVCVITGCAHDVKWNASRDINPDGWSDLDPVCFDIDPGAYTQPSENRFALLTARATGDTVKRLNGKFKATLSLRYSSRCNVSSIRLAAEISSLDGEIHTDTLNLRLFEPDGSPSGSGRLGLYEVSAPLPGILSVTDGTVICVSPISYSAKPKGLTSLTLLLR